MEFCRRRGDGGDEARRRGGRRATTRRKMQKMPLQKRSVMPRCAFPFSVLWWFFYHRIAGSGFLSAGTPYHNPHSSPEAHHPLNSSNFITSDPSFKKAPTPSTPFPWLITRHLRPYSLGGISISPSTSKPRDWRFSQSPFFAGCLPLYERQRDRQISRSSVAWRSTTPE